MPNRKLWLIRHAKSSWGQPGLSDFERPLNARGERDGPAMASWLAEQAHPASWIWSSSAVRARATAEFVRLGFGLSEDAVIASDELYHADREQLLDVIQQTPSAVESVALVAHNPGLTWLVNALGSQAATDNLPTFGVARFAVPGSWDTLRPASATLELLEGPKTIGTIG